MEAKAAACLAKAAACLATEVGAVVVVVAGVAALKVAVLGSVRMVVVVRSAASKSVSMFRWVELMPMVARAVAAVAAVVAAVMAMMAASAVAREPTAADVVTYPPCGWLPSRVTSEAGAVPLDSTRGTPHL